MASIDVEGICRDLNLSLVTPSGWGGGSVDQLTNKKIFEAVSQIAILLSRGKGTSGLEAKLKNAGCVKSLINLLTSINQELSSTTDKNSPLTLMGKKISFILENYFDYSAPSAERKKERKLLLETKNSKELCEMLNPANKPSAQTIYSIVQELKRKLLLDNSIDITEDCIERLVFIRNTHSNKTVAAAIQNFFEIVLKMTGYKEKREAKAIIVPYVDIHLPDVLSDLIAEYVPDCHYLTQEGKQCGRGKNFGFDFSLPDMEEEVDGDNGESDKNTYKQCLQNCREELCPVWLYDLIFNAPRAVSFEVETNGGNLIEDEWKIKNIHLSIYHQLERGNPPTVWEYSSATQRDHARELIKQACDILRENRFNYHFHISIQLLKPENSDIRGVDAQYVPNVEFSDFPEGKRDDNSYFTAIAGEETWEFTGSRKDERVLTTELQLFDALVPSFKPFEDRKSMSIKRKDESFPSSTQHKKSRLDI